jgi:hypothetical protein
VDRGVGAGASKSAAGAGEFAAAGLGPLHD